MELKVESSSPTAYVNRPSEHPQAIWRGRLAARSGRHVTGRAVDRMFVALRAYEQRAQRRAVIRAWLIRASTTPAPGSPGDLAA